MPSQEEYLDQLLRNVMNGGKGHSLEESAARENAQTEEEMYTDGTAGETQWPTDMEQPAPEMLTAEGMSGMYEGMSEEMLTAEGMPGMYEGMSEEMLTAEEMPGMYEGMPEEMLTAEGMPGMYEGMSEEMPAAEGMPGMYEGMPEEMPAAEELSGEMTEMFEEIPSAGEIPIAEELSAEPDMDELSAHMEELQGMPDGIQEAEGMPAEMPTAEEMPGLIGEAPAAEEMPAEEDDIEDLFKTFEEKLDVPMENNEVTETLPETVSEVQPSDFPDVLSEEEAAVEDSPTAADISSMSEDDIERLLAESSGANENSSDSPEEMFQGDVVELLQGTEDGELQEIQDLLEKSDNNEAVDDQIEAILKEAVQEDYRNSAGASKAEIDADQGEDAEEQLSPRQKKSMEKKRLKEEKAAAKKAAKEARKAEKAAKKAARKGGQNAEGAETAEAEQSVDTAFLDSILSEAGKIAGAETISSATGNYDIKVDNIIPDEEDAPTEGAAASADDGLGVDLENLFGGSAGAESEMMADGDSDLAGFVALDGKEVNGVIELGGGDEEEEKPKKKGFFSRFLEFLTEEEEEEEENEDIKLSEENQEIIEDLDKEKAQKDKKGKKGKKKAKKADASSEDGEEGEEGEGDKKEKKKKAKKPKKEKPPKEEEPVDPGKKLSLKKVLPILLICLSLGAAIIIMVYGFANFSDRKTARDAYYDGDYQTCYQNLYGKDLNESEQVMFGKSECILRIRMWIREYEILAAEGANLEALDSLIQSVNDYPALYDYAGQCNAAEEVAQEYVVILNLLYENYGLTEDQARAIAMEPDDIEYTRQVNAIVQGGSYGSWNEPEPEVNAPLQDELPEEAELPEGNFIDTNA